MSTMKLSPDEHWRLNRLRSRTCAINETRRENCAKGGRSTARYGPTFRRKFSSVGGLVTYYTHGRSHFVFLQRVGSFMRRFRQEVQRAIQT